MKGIVFNIQRFCTDDGPGIRTTVFLKGCNLRCFWCHNPESLDSRPQIQFFKDRCVSCGRCSLVCPVHAHDFTKLKQSFDRVKCMRCGRCAEACLSGALEASGREMSAPELMGELERDAPFYRNSGGGVTFSGGEPLLQKEFLKEALALCREKGIHTAVESALNVPWETLEQLKGSIGLFLIDVKLMDEEKHRRATGVSNRNILRNLERLARDGEEITVRIPVIPGVNTEIGEMAAIADFVSRAGIGAAEFMPYHGMAEGKYESLGLDYKGRELCPPAEELIGEITELFQSRKIKVL